MFILVIYALCAGVVGRAVEKVPQSPLILGSGARIVPGDSIVKLCPESRDSDLLVIERMVNEPQTPYL